MPIQRLPSSSPTAIQQKTTIGGIFDGRMPVADCTLSPDFSTYDYTTAAASANGLIFWNEAVPVLCTQLHVDLGGTGNIAVRIVNLDRASYATAPAVAAGTGQSVLVYQATATSFVTLYEGNFKLLLLPYQALQIITTTSGGVQVARAIGYAEKAYQR